MPLSRPTFALAPLSTSTSLHRLFTVCLDDALLFLYPDLDPGMFIK